MNAQTILNIQENKNYLPNLEAMALEFYINEQLDLIK